MNAIDLKRVEFRHYLETSGVMDALSYALIKLYDEIDKPNDPVAFVRQHFKRPTDTNQFTDPPKQIDELNATELIKKQEQELSMARQEIAKLRQMLNSMSSNSPLIEDTDDVIQVNEESTLYQRMFNDAKYDGTLVKKYLTQEMFEKFMNLQTKPSIHDCIANVDTLQSNPFGVNAISASCYTTFTDLFEPIIKEIHDIDEFVTHSDCVWGDANAFETFETNTIVSMEINCYRSLANIPFILGANEHDLQTILTTVQNAIQTAQGDDNEIDGEFYKITDVKEDEPIFEELQKTGLGFRSMNAPDHRLWPTGRALYINGARTQSIQINEEEHLRFISKAMSGDFGLIYGNLIELVRKFSHGIDFERSDKFGWITANPKLLGTGLQCKAHLKLQHSEGRIKKAAEGSKLMMIPIEETQSENELIIELINQRSFGLSEFECVKLFYDGIKEFLRILNCDDDQGDTDEKTNENVAQEPSEKANEIDSNNVDVETEQQNSNKDSDSKSNENDETKINNENPDENVENADKTEIAPSERTDEPVNNDEITVEKPSSDENNTNPLELNNITNENNTDNSAEGENVNEVNLQNNEIDPIETEHDATEQHNQIENEGTDTQSTGEQIEKDDEQSAEA